MGTGVFTRKAIYRRLKYALTRPRPPRREPPFPGPVVVVGSAPQSQRPKGFGPGYATLTVNGSQVVAADWGVAVPDATFMSFNQIEGQGANAQSVRQVLKGRRTGALYLMLWRGTMERLKSGLAAFDYSYDELHVVNRYQRMALLDRVAGLRNTEVDLDSKCSNGINAALFALNSGAPAVILSGINPASSGHVYNARDLPRHHQDMDMRVLATLCRKGAPVFTADPEVASGTGLPLWQP